jgi:hypothetical protein
VLNPSRAAVIVNGWDYPLLMRIGSFILRPVRVVKSLLTRRRLPGFIRKKKARSLDLNTGTHIAKVDANWLRAELADLTPIQIFVWRSLSTRMMRIFVHPWLGGRYLLKLIYALEERFPRFFGENGQYPLIVMTKPAGK